MSNPFFATLDFHGQALGLRSQRQTALASNIANVDTPGYKARDVDFAKELDRATAGEATQRAGTSASSAAATALQPRSSSAPVRAGHLPLGGATTTGTAGSQLLYRKPEQAAIDGNTVDLDRERAVFADNSLHYEATLRFINGHVRTMTSAIKGE